MEKRRSSLVRTGMLCLMALLFLSVTAFSQTRTITGKVTDATDKQPLAGVTVTVKGSTTSTQTGIDGTYKITVPSGATMLVFSFVGHGEQEVAIGSSGSVDAMLTPSGKSLDNVVVVGYGTQKRRLVTTAVDHVSAEDFRQSGARNALDLIQGKVAGLNVRRSSSNPNSGVTVQLRGVVSLTGDQSPLIVIDGIPGGNLDLLQQDDVESIDVLKDGSAAAIYGTQGNGGVILITTKKGKAGPARYDYSTYVRREYLYKRPDFFTPEEFRAAMQSGQLKGYTDYGATTDFFEALINKTNTTQYHTLGISGGTVNSNYRASVFYRDLQGFALENGRKEYGGRLSFNQKGLDNRLTVQLNLATNFNNANLLGGGGWEDQLTKNPTLSHYDVDGTWLFEGTSTNQVARLHQETNKRQQQTTAASGSATLEILKGLKGAVFASVQRDSYIDGEYRELASEFSKENDLQKNGGYARRATTLNIDYALEPTIEYTRTIKNDHNIGAIAGYSYRYSVYEGFSASNYGFVNDLFRENNLNAGSTLNNIGKGVSSYKGDNTLIAFFGRVNYAYQEKYMMQFILRREGSSRFGANNKWGNFPAASLAWNISRENFMKNIDVINNLKLRVGYGITGNQGIGNYSSLVTLGGGGIYRYPDGVYRETYGPNRNPNPNLRWEKKNELNIGVDFALLDSRLNGSIEVYKRETEDLLETYTSPQPPFVRESIYTNVGTISAKGIELTINAIPVRTKNFTWSLDFTGNTTKNKLDKLSNEIYKLPYREYGGIGGFGALGNAIRTYEGGDLGEFWAKRFAGFQPNGEWLFYNRKGEKVLNKDINNSFDKSTTDLTVAGNSIPKFYLSMTNSFQYKNFDFRFYLRGKFGHKILNTMGLSYGNITSKTNLLRSSFTKYAEVNAGTSPSAYMYSDYYIESGDFVKLDEVTLGYNFKLKTKYLRNLRVYATGQNLATITGYTGNDPDFVNDTGLGGGIDSRGPYPSTSSVLIGLSVGF
ncbi:SusC/RagA family TonB-linked outer membrane protein [Pseudoflavitalea sp. X16]|uniref:SusC/RagA family TonB-linked outer membrane protein n=1 Tax=Paraflavitalea devenefica TaxID=2716334 RepID=UPI001420D4EE|nr:SusC/RagA family TonB-linked outer membrane protein [Paraflavitalea devenefica]NII27533.1 SusC/RagA family TonB-linked outer membrane protein [Paraflavitalea devenefica]